MFSAEVNLAPSLLKHRSYITVKRKEKFAQGFGCFVGLFSLCCFLFVCWLLVLILFFWFFLFVLFLNLVKGLKILRILEYVYTKR